MTQNPTPKRADQVDQVVGARVRAARITADLSQERLAGACGVTFQQIQKYENGSNRISCGRLVQLAHALGTTPAKLLAEPFVMPGAIAKRTRKAA